MRAAVRRVFSKALQCRTAELGAEVYSSENQELILYHTCKSRACPSCGYRASVQWLRERWAALPNSLYKGITFSMPDVLWPLFRDNPPLAKALSALAAEVIQARISAKYGLRVGVIAILHGCIARPKEEKIRPDVVTVLDALQHQEARQPGSVAVRVGRHKRTVVLIGQDLFGEPHSQKELHLT